MEETWKDKIDNCEDRQELFALAVEMAGEIERLKEFEFMYKDLCC